MRVCVTFLFLLILVVTFIFFVDIIPSVGDLLYLQRIISSEGVANYEIFGNDMRFSKQFW